MNPIITSCSATRNETDVAPSGIDPNVIDNEECRTVLMHRIP
jgi:hypothetical protein